ncbi:hypothetical protein [Bradyrhizobium elkanii]|uniref:hypothetical protein n=1 Tax=Bradyrhizobium elkanii TaxID=29448 RepID=UPI001484EF15|nr:hypothetical protein [Bradyrhizobium elkanii]
MKKLAIGLLDDAPAIRRGAHLTLCLPLAEALPVSLAESFYDAFVGLLRLPQRLDVS